MNDIIERISLLVKARYPVVQLVTHSPVWRRSTHGRRHMECEPVGHAHSLRALKERAVPAIMENHE